MTRLLYFSLTQLLIHLLGRRYILKSIEVYSCYLKEEKNNHEISFKQT